MGATASKQPHPEVKLAVAQVAANGQSAAEKMDHTAQVSSAAKADDASLDKPEAALEKAPDAPLDAVKGKAGGVPDVTVDMLTELFKSHRAMANTAVQKAGPCKTGGIGSDMMAAAMVGCGRLAGRGGGAPSNALLETFLQLKAKDMHMKKYSEEPCDEDCGSTDGQATDMNAKTYSQDPLDEDCGTTVGQANDTKMHTHSKESDAQSPAGGRVDSDDEDGGYPGFPWGYPNSYLFGSYGGDPYSASAAGQGGGAGYPLGLEYEALPQDAACKEAMSLNAAAAQAAGSGADWAPGGHDEVFMKVATPLRNTRGKPGVIGARS